MYFSVTDPVRPLAEAESHFLEVLLRRLVLTRQTGQDGVRLDVEFGDDTPAVWNSRGRRLVRQRMAARSNAVAATYQASLNEMLIERKDGTFAPDDEEFLWRWASAGALPIVRIKETDYYCLFYRDVFPIGWNIANGACADRSELLDPVKALERELGEELVVLSPGTNTRYVLQPGDTKNLGRPDSAGFRRLWHDQFPGLDIERYEVRSLAVDFDAGPDLVTVRADHGGHQIADCFVNINAADFGIELDRIARIALVDGAVLCDGEIDGHRILNRPVGLFEVRTLQEQAARGEQKFLPDLFFHGGLEFDGAEFPRVLRDVVTPDVMRRSDDIARTFAATGNALNLCPVTSTLVRRHAATLGDAGEDRGALLTAGRTESPCSRGTPD